MVSPAASCAGRRPISCIWRGAASGGGRSHRLTWRRLYESSPPTPGDRVAPSGPGAHRAKRNAHGVGVIDCVTHHHHDGADWEKRRCPPATAHQGAPRRSAPVAGRVRRRCTARQAAAAAVRARTSASAWSSSATAPACRRFGHDRSRRTHQPAVLLLLHPATRRRASSCACTLLNFRANSRSIHLSCHSNLLRHQLAGEASVR